MAATAQTGPRVYAAVSLIGDNIDVVTSQMTTGSNVDRNIHELMPVIGGAFDKAAILAIDDALKRDNPAATVKMFAPSTASFFRDQDRFFNGDKVMLPVELDVAIRKAAATHLILVTKLRQAAQLQVVGQKIGSGSLEGLGFYIDPAKNLYRSDTGESGQGYLAPYVYIRYTLVDLASNTALRNIPVTASPALSTARSKDGFDPWNILTPAQKTDILRRIITSETARVVPELIARP